MILKYQMNDQCKTRQTGIQILFWVEAPSRDFKREVQFEQRVGERREEFWMRVRQEQQL